MSKYKNEKATVDGIIFDSKREAKRYLELRWLAQAGEISQLRFQVPFSIDFDGHHICKYIADFVYQENGKEIVEDAKGVRTALYKLKAKLVLAFYGIKIKEV